MILTVFSLIKHLFVLILSYFIDALIRYPNMLRLRFLAIYGIAGVASQSHVVSKGNFDVLYPNDYQASIEFRVLIMDFNIQIISKYYKKPIPYLTCLFLDG